MKYAGIDTGYHGMKGVCNGTTVVFDTVVGELQTARFKLDDEHGNGSLIQFLKPFELQVGSSALTTSRFVSVPSAREWWRSRDWYAGFLGVLTELSNKPTDDFTLVMGLPISVYEHDRAGLAERVKGIHSVQRVGREVQQLKVADVLVIPQGWGIYLAETLTATGKVKDNALARAKCGVIDGGGKTTGMLSVTGLREIPTESRSINLGGADLVRAVRENVQNDYPDWDRRDHEAIADILDGSIVYGGKKKDIKGHVKAAIAPMAAQVVSEARNLWKGASSMQYIMIGGGAGVLLAPFIKEAFPQARLVKDARLANGRGYYYLAQRMKPASTKAKK